jgi:hypothetical protein
MKTHNIQIILSPYGKKGSFVSRKTLTFSYCYFPHSLEPYEHTIFLHISLEFKKTFYFEMTSDTPKMVDTVQHLHLASFTLTLYIATVHIAKP